MKKTDKLGLKEEYQVIIVQYIERKQVHERLKEEYQVIII